MYSTIVPDNRRSTFLPAMFGSMLKMLTGENTVYNFMTQLSDDYGGGFWDFYETENGARFMAPRHDKPFKMAWWGNGFEGEVEPETAGIIACLFTFSHMNLAEAYSKLFEFACEHKDAAIILQAID